MEYQSYNTKVFEKSGKQNTNELMLSVNNYISSCGETISKLVISSTTGYTYFESTKYFSHLNIQTIVCCQDLSEEYSMGDENRKKIAARGVQLIDIPKKYLASKASNDTTRILRNFSEGIKVCFEMIEFLLEANLINENEILVTIAGTLRGADTALVFKILSKKKYKVLRMLTFPEMR